MPAAAQDNPATAEPDENRIQLDLSLPHNRTLQDEECNAQTDAARVTGEIVVCRSLDESSDGYWDLDRFEKNYAERTPGIGPPDVDGSGLILPTEGSIATITLTIKLGKGKEPSYQVGFDALPEPPAQDQSPSGL